MHDQDDIDRYNSDDIIKEESDWPEMSASQVYVYPYEQQHAEEEEKEGKDGWITQKKVRGRPKRSLQEDYYNWSDDATFTLIKYWKEQDVLYNPGNIKYHIKGEHSNAMEIIRAKLKDKGIDVSSKQIQGKFLSLKGYFCKERSKAAVSRKKVNGHPYESRWKFYASLSFLDQHVVPRQTISHLAAEAEGDYSMSPSQVKYSRYQHDSVGSSEGYPSYESSYREPTSQATSTSTKPSSSYCSKDDDEVFGDIVIRMMKKVRDGEKKDFLKINIQQMILQTIYQDGSTSSDGGKNNNNNNDQSELESSRSSTSTPDVVYRT